MEIEAALAGQVRVIPVLVGDAQMPQPEDLPESMQPLLRRNAYSISDRRWQYDMEGTVHGGNNPNQEKIVLRRL